MDHELDEQELGAKGLAGDAYEGSRGTDRPRRMAKRAVAGVLLIALSLMLTAVPAAAWLHAPTPDIKIIGGGSKVVRTYSIDVNAVCRWQYGSAWTAKMVGQSWRDWRCVSGASSRSVNFTGYCRTTYGHGKSGNVVSATHNTVGSWTVTSWRCRVESPRWA